MNVISRLLFEYSPWTPFWSALLVGFCIVGGDGQVYLTESGQNYLDDMARVG